MEFKERLTVFNLISIIVMFGISMTLSPLASAVESEKSASSTLTSTISASRWRINDIQIRGLQRLPVSQIFGALPFDQGDLVKLGEAKAIIDTADMV